jgi:hypothetical protein
MTPRSLIVVPIPDAEKRKADIAHDTSSSRPCYPFRNV